MSQSTAYTVQNRPVSTSRPVNQARIDDPSSASIQAIPNPQTTKILPLIRQQGPKDLTEPFQYLRTRYKFQFSNASLVPMPLILHNSSRFMHVKGT
ncbi:hypothetical protein IFM46972_01798 [Aspergillus udagawae]|uniref:Uncharacterized protein n=1 Tax=Aspergillus udagawae TaxID=91492 RepID=A0A8H3NC17_9EURO|nr:hypothetical protein IFM46972_01798 [Aspergillus udagawae]